MSTEPFPLSDRATAAQAEEMVALAVNHDASKPFEIDASEIETIDGPVVLAIVNISHTLSANDGKVAILKPTSAFVDAFTDLGMFQDLMKMEFRQ